MLSEEEKYYNKIMKQDKMSIEEAENIIDEMYQDKYKIIEENNTIYVDRLDEVKFTNLEFASVRMLREVQNLRRKLEKLQKEIEKKNKIIDLIVKMINTHDIYDDICGQFGKNKDCSDFTNEELCIDCIKQYFYRKVEEEIK